MSNPSADVSYPFLGLSGSCFEGVRSYYNRFIYAFPNGVIKVNLPSDTFAFGVDLGPFCNVAGTFAFTTSDGEEYQFPWNPIDGGLFFGLVSDTPITWVTFNYDNTYFILDNFAITSTAGPGRGCPVPEFLPVEIDIKPGSDPNCFNINGNGVVPTAILGDSDFDVADVRLDSLSLGGLDVRVRGRKGPLCSFEFVNEDSFVDLVCQFEDDATAWTGGGTIATLGGELLDGTPIEGADSICIVP